MATLNLNTEAEPKELQGEPRWSSIRYAPHPRPAQWTHSIDEELVQLVTQSTASGERFPVGVNWLEVSRVVRQSPVDCVKRYAFLHDARDRSNTQEEEHNMKIRLEKKGETEVLEEELEGALLDSDEYLENQTSLSDFGTPIASPKILGAFDEFETSRPASPNSPPPFAISKPSILRQSENAEGSPFRWEDLVNDPKYTAPVLHSPPSRSHKQNYRDRHELEDVESKSVSPRQNPRGFMLPTDSKNHIKEIGSESAFSPSVLTHTLKGVKLGVSIGSPILGSPLIKSPRFSRKISNSKYPFLKDEGVSTRQSPGSNMSDYFRDLEGAGIRAGSYPNESHDATVNELQSQMNAHLLPMSATSELSAIHGDDPFLGSMTQSALEDAFLDMAGSRLDASSILLGSRMSTARLEHILSEDRRDVTRKSTE
ncbi:hypothetical protein Plhal304r1_c028g0094051 [Plasmopara halstedii]